MKRSQIASQAFVYILGLVVIIIVAFVAYKGISNWIRIQKEIEIVDFKDDFTEILRATRDIGEMKEYERRLPRDFTAICFYDSNATGMMVVPYQKPFVEELSVSNNVFLIKNKVPIKATSVKPFNASKINLGLEKYKCFDFPSGLLRLKLSGAGKKGTKIEAI